MDASIVVKLLLGGLHPRVLGRDQLAAPHLIDSEVLSSLRRNVLHGAITEEAAVRGLETFEGIAIQRFPTAPLRRRIWDLRHNLSAYDATYVALAESLESRLLTADARLARASGPRCHVEVL